MQKKRKRDESETVNEHQREEVWKLYTNHFLLQPAISAISKKILGKGIKISKKLNGANLGNDINTLVERRYRQFVKEAIDNIAVQGFFAYHIVPNDARLGRLSFPVVVPWHLYEAKFGFSANFEPEITCRAKTEEGKKFYSVGVYPVTREVSASYGSFGLLLLFFFLQGTLTSPVASASKYCFILDDAEKYDALAYNILCDPPVLTRHKTDHAFDSRDLIGGAVPGLMAQTENDNMQLRNKINMNMYKQQQQLIAVLNERGIDTASAFWESCLNPATGKELESNFSQQYVPKFVPLPSDAEVAQMQLPHARSDMVNFRKQCFEIISTALGVPLNVMSSIGGSNVTKAQTQAEHMFRTTCMDYANILKVTLAEIFTQTFTTLKAQDVTVEFPGLDEEIEDARPKTASVPEHVKKENF